MILEGKKNIYNNKMKNGNKRIFPGIYRRYDGTEIEVLLVTKDADTGEETVVCKLWYHDKPEDYFTISKASFCGMVDTPTGPKPKYKRETQYKSNESDLWYYHDHGINQMSRIKRRHRTDTSDEYPVVRTLHASETYLQYALELCKFHLADTRRVKLCTESKRLYGISKEEYDTLLADVRFTNNCFKTVLREYAELFYGRYGSKQLSIRKYAEEYQMNRGSVVYAQEKMLRAFAKELEERDKTDGITRIKPNVEGEI